MVCETEKIRYISHEVKNQLSICDLYTEIIQKYCDKNEIHDATILNAVKNIKNALRTAGNSMSELKSAYSFEMKEYDLADLLNEAVELSRVYGEKDSVNCSLNVDNAKVKVDKNLFTGVIVNLIKNACEAFEDEPEKNVEITTVTDRERVKIIVSNNAKPIEKPDEIFKDGVTTKQTGLGIGLYISKKNIEKMEGKINLLKSDEISTDFEIELKTV
ncbi:MAG: HAMP domain-containing histidine kinase [Cyanobacteria bacterium RUI128]|nr:HAMP domain-containing histidine kinase [Cyanobacteria bacterium RUI128]